MSFVRIGRVLSSAAIVWAIAISVKVRAADVGTAPLVQPASAPATPKPAEPQRTPEQIAARAEAQRLLKEVNAVVSNGETERGKQMLGQIEALMRQAGDYGDEAEYLVRLGQGTIALTEQRNDDAERSFLAALEAVTRFRGPDCVDVAQLNMFVAAVRLARHGLTGMKPRLDAAYAIYHKLDDPEDATARKNLMCLMMYEAEQKRPDLAAAYASEWCERWRRAKNPNDPDHLLALQALALYQRQLGDLAGTRVSLDEAAEVSSRLNGPYHAETLKLRQQALKTAEAFTQTEQWGKLVVEAKQLADGLDSQSKEPEALRNNIPRLQRLIEISKLIERPTDAGSAKWLFILAYNHDQLDETPEAMRLYREFITVTDKVSKEIDGEKGAALLRLSRAEANQGDFAQARAHAARVAEHFAADPNMAKREMPARKYLTVIDCAAADWPAALDHLDRYAELTRMIHRERLKEEILFRARIAYLCGAEPKLKDRCRAILDEACRTSTETFGPQSAEAGSALQWLAMFQYRAADATCVETLSQADRILAAAAEETDADSGYRRLRVAKYHRAFGKLDQARAMYEAELQRLRASVSPDPNRLAIGLGFLAAIDAHQGRKVPAEERYHEAIELAAAGHDEIAKDLARFLGRQRDELAAGRLPALAPADNADEVAARVMIP